MDNEVFWNKLTEMDYEDILHWARSEQVQGLPCKHNACLLADLGQKVTGEEWSFASRVYSASDLTYPKAHSINGREITPAIKKIMGDFDGGKLSEFVTPGIYWDKDRQDWSHLIDERDKEKDTYGW